MAGSYLNWRKRIGARKESAKKKNTKTRIGGEPNLGFIVQYIQIAQHTVIIDTKR